VTRRPDPERIYQARRSATFRRLVDVDHVDELDAEHWIARWERQAESQGLERLTPEFWDAGGRWILDERAVARRSGRI
jgi:hypothetical protein